MVTYTKFEGVWSLNGRECDLKPGALVVVSKKNGSKQIERVLSVIRASRLGNAVASIDPEKSKQRGGTFLCPLCEDDVRPGSLCYQDKTVTH